jgi:preprotein translocase subunit SecA
MMEALKLPDDMPIENIMITKSIETAQKRIEGHNYDIRKHILKYDDVANKQREIIYKKRKEALLQESVNDKVIDFIKSEINFTLKTNYNPNSKKHNKENIIKQLEEVQKISDLENLIKDEDPNLTEELITDSYLAAYKEKSSSNGGQDTWKDVEKHVYLKIIDTLWMEHIDNMSHLRENVSLQGYGQRDPLILYKQEGFDMFKELLGKIQFNFLRTIFHVSIQPEASFTATPQKKEEAPKEDKEIPVAGSALFDKRI